MSQHQDHQRRDHRLRLTTAALTGLLAGVARAVTEWLLHHLTYGGRL